MNFENKEKSSMMTQDDIQAMREYGFQLLYEDGIGKIYYSTQISVFICEIVKEYIPIERFKNLLMVKAQMLKQHPCKKFIFDNREIRSFHQPSMEWYYIVWKPKMYEKFGLSVYRKLFTTELWFRKCIEVGLIKIKQSHPDNISHQLDIQVKESIREAIFN
ncbi:MAG: hypothetical protein HC880_12000 [Bacteroidia bacterium]|nr:hypothetical protein [Bacteroidia bacterium]